ncbi:hypothetical protein EVAR_101587_1 [Eumeta japonica]|uniref:Uncharacterized protein n=1 Tax=Eumeta variegata TaxID=151549 RepID=A0A4C1STS6_EUMVA|nr:hypothetical protein EVAR_101587_1 [Eumeta japonica]
MRRLDQYTHSMHASFFDTFGVTRPTSPDAALSAVRKRPDGDAIKACTPPLRRLNESTMTTPAAFRFGSGHFRNGNHLYRKFKAQISYQHRNRMEHLQRVTISRPALDIVETELCGWHVRHPPSVLSPANLNTERGLRGPYIDDPFIGLKMDVRGFVELTGGEGTSRVRTCDGWRDNFLNLFTSSELCLCLPFSKCFAHDAVNVVAVTRSMHKDASSQRKTSDRVDTLNIGCCIEVGADVKVLRLRDENFAPDVVVPVPYKAVVRFKVLLSTPNF